jgi:prepilin-type processing-associated H-X9-DG protein
VDQSPHWSVEEGGQGIPVPGSGGMQFRRTSYGVNNYLTTVAPFDPYLRLGDVSRPTATVHFLYMAEQGEYAGADHPHVENWGADANTPIRAANHLQIAAHGGPEKSFDSITNYGFLDGHAETRKFRDVYLNFEINSFDPKVAQ